MKIIAINHDANDYKHSFNSVEDLIAWLNEWDSSFTYKIESD